MEPETQLHVFCCTATQSIATRKNALDILEDKLVQAATHPDLVTLILLAVKGEYETLRSMELTDGEGMAALFDQQSRIGWHLVKYGILTVAWTKEQDKWSARVHNATGDTKR